MTKKLAPYGPGLRRRVLKAYGSKCECCDERTPEFLDVVQKADSTATGRRETGAFGRSIYRWLETEGFPAGFGLLCHNCRWAAELSGSCPHEGRTQNGRSQESTRITRARTLALGQRP